MAGINTIYLDHNATSPLRPEAMMAMQDVALNPLNPSSVHRTGQYAHALLNQTRRFFQDALGAAHADVVFTSGGTEANHLALTGLSHAGNLHIITTQTEHVSVLENAKNARFVPVNAHGIVDVTALDKMLAQLEGRALVSVQLANNETGVIQPLKDIADVVYAHKGFLHTDASQAVGRIDVSMEALNVDVLTFSCHKYGGPVGVGVLMVKKGVNITPQTKGGAQENRLRAGTQAVHLAVGAAKALEIAPAPNPQLRDALEATLKAIAPNAVIHGAGAPRLPNTTHIFMPHVPAESQLIQLDLAGIAISAGSACTSGKVETSHVLKAMNVADDVAQNSIRISMGWDTTPEHVEACIKAWESIYQKACAHLENQAA